MEHYAHSFGQGTMRTFHNAVLEQQLWGSGLQGVICVLDDLLELGGAKELTL